MKFTIIMAAPSMARTMPVTRFNVTGSALFASFAAILAHSRVEIMQKRRHHTSGMPPMAKWLTEPVNAVKVMIKTLVPTAVFNS